MKRAIFHPFLLLAVLLSLLGVAAFIVLFGPIFNIYWLILAPVILTLYQFPAVYVFLLWKKRTGKGGGPSDGSGTEKEKNAPDGI